MRDVAELSHGQVIEALVANRLTSPAPLVHVRACRRPHQSHGQRPSVTETPVTRPITDLADVRSIGRQPVLAGLINWYYRAA